MFEELFTTSEALQKHRTAPLAEQRLSYLDHLVQMGASWRTLRLTAMEQTRLVHLLDLKEGDTVSIPRIEAVIAEWSRPGDHRHHRTVPTSPASAKRVVRRAIGWLRFLGWLEEATVAQPPHRVELDSYEAWMREERGLSERTIRLYRHDLDDFFDWLDANDLSLPSVTLTGVDTVIVAKNATGCYSRGTIGRYARCIRAFFRFAEDRGWCRPGIAAALIPPRVYPTNPVPAGLNREDIERLLVTTEGERTVDKRDRAILMLLVAYGLRSGEVRRLQLDDLDWENEMLRVRRSKSGRTDIFPLSRGVGQAILRYILEVRPPRPERTLFLTLFAPIRPLSRGVMTNIVRNRLRRVGVVDGPRGPHALRHAAARHLLGQGMSMKEIGDFLGHRSPSATAVYAKVDLNALRKVADFDLEGLA
ncbi:MAG: tyrosine-type recombinase/integrase [Chloroflexi bacterium]|nr:tyrosine-type recombinase/integrase [Chloroflexota bacterium]